MSQDLMTLIHQAGFTGDAANTMYGIVMAESGGNAGAHNTNTSTGDNSYGLSQINMLGSMGPARLAQYGLSSNNDLFDPATNLRVAYALSNGGKDFTPWSTFKSGAYKDAAPGGVVSNESTQAGASTPVTSSKVSAAQMANQADLGPYLGLFNSVPELKTLMANAINIGQSPQDFAAEVQKSEWWRGHADSVRKAVAQQTADPASYKAAVGQYQATVKARADQLGVMLDPHTLSSLATQGYSQGWSTDQLNFQLASKFNRNGQLSGQAAQTYQQLAAQSSAYGQAWNDSALRFRTQQVLAGNQTVDGYVQSMRNQAKVMYPGWAHQLDAGLTVEDIASPYKQSMAQVLELDPSKVTATDPLVRQALTGNAATKNQPLTMGAFEDTLRKDPRWGYTDNAKQTMASSMAQIGRDFGFGV